MAKGDSIGDLEQARAALEEARQAFGRRAARETVRLAYLACFLAASALWRVMRLQTGRDEPVFDRPEIWSGGPAGKSLTGFYRQLGHFKKRLDNDPDTYINIEEVANWLRQAAAFVQRISTIVRRQAGPPA